MTTPIARLWFWITHTTRCSWCRRILHRRWLWLPAQSVGYGVKLPRVTDGICPACFHDLLKGAQ
jgi:hypothetical protein